MRSGRANERYEKGIDRAVHDTPKERHERNIMQPGCNAIIYAVARQSRHRSSLQSLICECRFIYLPFFLLLLLHEEKWSATHIRALNARRAGVMLRNVCVFDCRRRRSSHLHWNRSFSHYRIYESTRLSRVFANNASHAALSRRSGPDRASKSRKNSCRSPQESW